MELRKNGLVYTVAYLSFNKPKDNRTNLCNLFWKLMFSIFVLLPGSIVICIFAVVISAMIYIVGTPIAFLLYGYRPIVPATFREFMDNFPDFFIKISWWPKVRGHHVMPGNILVAAVLIGLVGLLIKLFFVSVFASTLGTSIFALVVAILLGFIGYSISKNTEGYQVVREYAKAKKARFCPIVEFVK